MAPFGSKWLFMASYGFPFKISSRVVKTNEGLSRMVKDGLQLSRMLNEGQACLQAVTASKFSDMRKGAKLRIYFVDTYNQKFGHFG
jgi:hypothetical protein